MSFHSNMKTSVNRTGVMFYSKIPESQNYRVRFKSFNMSMYDNQPKIDQMQKMYKNYVLFKQGKSAIRQKLPTSLATKKQSEEQKYKTNKERLKENQNLRNRLKSMKNDRKSFLEKIKVNTIITPEQSTGNKQGSSFITKYEKY